LPALDRSVKFWGVDRIFMLSTRVFRLFARWFGRLKFIRFGIRDRVARAAENPGDRQASCLNGVQAIGGETFSQPFYGGTYVGNTGNFIDWSARYFGAYSVEELDLYSDICLYQAPPYYVLDIGANVGNHSLYYGLTGAHVFSFEPNPDAIKLLVSKIRANSGVDIHPIQKGLSDRGGMLELCLPDNKNLGRSSFDKKVGTEAVIVEVSRADDLVEIQDAPRITYIKIDVEGHELKVLSGLRQTLFSCRPPVFVECNRIESIDRLSSLFPSGYYFYEFARCRETAFFFDPSRYRLRMPDVCNVLAWPFEALPLGLKRKLSN
jgi:FkbM family methyltransferase